MHSGPSTPLAIAISLVTTLAFHGALLPAAYAEQPPTDGQAAVVQQKSFNIPPGPLSQVLSQFAGAAGVALSFDAARFSNVSSPGLQGNYSIDQGFAELLKGTGVNAVHKGNGDYALTEGKAAMLPAVNVLADANPSALPEAYAGGQVARGGNLGLLGNVDYMESPFNQSSYTAEVMRNQQATTIADALANDPAVRESWPSTGYSAPLMIRGFAASNQDVAFAGLYGVAPTFAVSAGMAERVEVLKGPAALLTGMQPSGSVGGSVNIVPKRATPDPVTQLTLNYQSDSQLAAQIDVGRRLGAEQRTGVRVNAMWQEGDAPVDDQERKLASAVVGADYQGEKLRLMLDIGYQQQQVDAPSLITFVRADVPVPTVPDTSSNWFFPWSWVDIDDTFGAARAEYDVATDWTVYAAVGGKETHWDRLTYFPTVTTESGDISARPGQLSYRYLTDTQETGVRGRFDTGSVTHQLTLSGNRYRQRTAGASASLGTAIASNLYDPVDVPAPATVELDPSTLNDNTLTSVAIGDVMSMWDDTLQLILGLRQQNIEAQNFNATGASTSRYDEEKMTPAAGVVFKLSPQMSLYGNYIEGLQQGAVVGSTYSNAGQTLAPYVSKQYEIGLKTDWEHMGATLALFQITQPSGYAPTANGIFAADGEQRNRGLELNLFGNVVDQVRLLGGLSLLDAELTNTANGLNDGNDAPGVPELQTNLGAEWDMPFDRALTLSGRVIHTSDQQVDNANTQDIPSWNRVDIGARYQLTAGETPVTVRAQVENALGEDYWSSSAYAPGWLAAGAPRTVKLSTTIDF